MKSVELSSEELTPARGVVICEPRGIDTHKALDGGAVTYTESLSFEPSDVAVVPQVGYTNQTETQSFIATTVQGEHLLEAYMAKRGSSDKGKNSKTKLRANRDRENKEMRDRYGLGAGVRVTIIEGIPHVWKNGAWRRIIR